MTMMHESVGKWIANNVAICNVISENSLELTEYLYAKFLFIIIQKKNEYSYPSIVDSTRMAKIENGWHQPGKVLIFTSMLECGIDEVVHWKCHNQVMLYSLQTLSVIQFIVGHKFSIVLLLCVHFAVLLFMYLLEKKHLRTRWIRAGDTVENAHLTFSTECSTHFVLWIVFFSQPIYGELWYFRNWINS